MFFLRTIKSKIKSLISSIVYKTDHFSDMQLIDKEFINIYKQCAPYTVTSKLGLYATYKSIEYIVKKKLPGDIVECGVWKGGSALLIILTLIKFDDTNRKIYLYDTYSGMTKPTEEDYSLIDKKSALLRWEKSKFIEWGVGTINEVKKLLISTGYPIENIIFIKGDIKNTLTNTKPKIISLLRLDTDWHESTRHELENLYPILLTGGVLIVDDYGYWAGSKKAVDNFFDVNRPILLNRIDQTGRIGIKN